MTWRNLTFLFLGLITVVRFCMLPQMELVSDEAYYYQWAQRLDWGYYSKGPGIALVIAAGTHLFGATEFGVRFFAPIFALGTSLLLFALGRRLYDERTGALAAIVMNLLPIFNVGGLLMTIDPISIFCWTAGLYAFWRACERSPKFSGWWIIAGLATGAGFLAKYTNAMALLSMLLVLLSTRKLRGEWKRPGIWIMLISFSIWAIPPVIWNMQNQWITVLHLKQRGQLDSAFVIRPLELLEFIGIHLGVYSPLIFLAMIAALYAACKNLKPYRERFLVLFALPLMLLYAVLSLKRAGEANWTAPAFISLGLLAVAWWLPKLAASAAWRKTAIVGGILAAIMSCMVVNTDLVRSLGIPWSYRKDPGGRLRGWETAAKELEKVRQLAAEHTGSQAPFLIAGKYQDAASFQFYFDEKIEERPGHPAIYMPETPVIMNQYSFWGRYDEFELEPTSETKVSPAEESEDTFDDPYTEQKGVNRFIGRNAIAIGDEPHPYPAAGVQTGFGGWEEFGILEVKRRGLTVRKWKFFLSHDYQTSPL